MINYLDNFAEAIEQLDPASEIEEEYKIVNDGQWGWRALRLLAKKSPNFFTYGNNPIAKLPDYLESILKKMYPELVAAQAARPKIEATSPGASTNGSKTAKDSANELCTKEQLEKLASNLGENWPKLLPKLGMDKSEEEKLTSEGKTHAGRFPTNLILIFVLSFSSKKIMTPTKIKGDRVIMYTNSNTVVRKHKQSKVKGKIICRYILQNSI